MPRKPAAPKKKVWKAFSTDTYEAALRTSVHFSAKTVNSNTPAFGVRLGTHDRIDLPYVGVSTTRTPTPVDYAKQVGAVATVMAQASAVLDERLHDYEAPLAEDVAAIRTAAGLLETHYETASTSVGVRLRQIIVQDAEGQDIVLTPLQSAGFSELVNRRLEEEYARSDGTAYRKRGVLGIGGANPQNVARYARAMQRPLWFRAPTEQADMRKAYALHYQGLRVEFPKDRLMDYYHWRRALVEAHGGVMPSGLHEREHEKQQLQFLVGTVMARADEARALLEQYRDKLPGRALVDGALPVWQRGLLDPSARGAAWKRCCVHELHNRLLNQKIYVGGKPRSLGIGEVESISWIRIIEECL